MQTDRSSSRFLGSTLFRGLSVLFFFLMVGAFFVANAAGGASPEPLSIRIAVPAETFDWVEQNAEEFNRTNPKVGGQAITVEVSSYGGIKQVAEDVGQSSGGVDPYVGLILKASPGADTKVPVYTSGNYGPAPVARTFIIGVIRGEYADALGRQLGRARLSLADLPTLFDPNAPAGSPVLQVQSGKPHWGAISSEDDFDGPFALYALAMGLRQTGSPRISDPALEAQVKSIYATASQSRTTFDLLGDDMAKFGPTGPSTAMLSEVVALSSAQSLVQKGQKLQLLYPSNGLELRFNYYLVTSDGVTNRQRDAAVKFREFLRGREGQATAAGHGLRPPEGSTSVPGDLPLWQKLGPLGAESGYQPSVVQISNVDWAEVANLVARVVTK